jgi:hypothetical protein
MALTKFNKRAVREADGGIVAGATVTFYSQSSGIPTAVFSDVDGDDSLGSSVMSEADGSIPVFMTPGVYRITIEYESELAAEYTYEAVFNTSTAGSNQEIRDALYGPSSPQEYGSVAAFLTSEPETESVKINSYVAFSPGVTEPKGGHYRHQTGFNVGNTSVPNPANSTEGTAANGNAGYSWDAGGREWYYTINGLPVMLESFISTQEWIDFCVENNQTPGAETLFNSDNTWTVDSSGANFTTVSAAIKFLFHANSAYRDTGSSGDNSRQTINIETGYIFAEQVWFEGVDLSFITITSTDAEVTINRSALVRPVGVSEIRYMAFNFRYGCISPVIDVLFNMDTSGTATGRGGCRVEAGSYAYWANGSGIKNVADRGLHLVNSTAWANSTVWSGAGNRGIRIGNVSNIWAENADCTNAGESGIGVDSCCMANVRNADCSGAAVYGLLAIGCVVDAEGLTANNCGTNGIFAQAGATVNAEGASIDAAGDSGVEVHDGSTLIAKGISITNSTASNLFVRNRSTADVHSGTLTGAGTHNIHGQNSSIIDASGATATGATNRGAFADASEINLVGADVSGSGDANDVLISNGSKIQFNSATGTTSETLNTLVSRGVVFG